MNVLFYCHYCTYELGALRASRAKKPYLRVNIPCIACFSRSWNLSCARAHTNRENFRQFPSICKHFMKFLAKQSSIYQLRVIELTSNSAFHHLDLTLLRAFDFYRKIIYWLPHVYGQRIGTITEVGTFDVSVSTAAIFLASKLESL